MKFFTFLLLFLSFGHLSAQIVNFTDPDFKNKLLESSPSNTIAKNLQGAYFAIDANGDNEIQVSEAAQVSELVFTSHYVNPINSIIGIESFVNLVYIDFSYNTLLEEAQLTNFQHLTGVRIVSGQSLKKLIITDNPVLTNIDFSCTNCSPTLQELDTLICCKNNLSSLSIANGGNSNLNYLDFSDNHISNFSFHWYNALDYLDLSGNDFTELEVALSGLEKLIFDDNPLINLHILYTSYDTLNIVNFPDLTSIDVMGSYGHQLKYLNLSNLPSLHDIDCSYNDFTHLKFENLPSLVSFNIENMEMDLTLHNLPAITNLDFSKFDLISNLTISELNNLTNIQTRNEDDLDLSSLVISDMENLSTADFELYTHSFSITNTPSLETLLFDNHRVTNRLVFSDLPDLNYLYVFANAFDSTIIFNNLPSLKYLEVISVLDSLPIHDLPALSDVILMSRDIKNLDLANVPALHKLELKNCFNLDLELTNIPLKVLKMLDTYQNGASDWGSLTLGNLPQLDSVSMSVMKLESIDFNNLPQLHYINLYGLTLQTPLIFNELPELHSLTLNYCNLDTLIMSGLENLENLKINKSSYEWYGGPMSAFEFSDLPALRYLSITENEFLNTISFDITGFHELYTFEYNQYLNNLTIGDLPSLTNLSINTYYAEDTIRISGFPSLKTFNFETSGDKIIHMYNLPVLENLSLSTFQGEVDLSGCPSLDVLDLNFWYHLDFLNLRNGNSSLSSFQIEDYIVRMCVDSDAEADLLRSFDPEHLNNTIFTTDCPTNPCPMNVITGTIAYDPDNNNCLNTQLPCANTKVIIAGDNTFETFTDSTGSFKFITQLLNHDLVITPVFEEPYFISNPQSTTISFDNFGNDYIADFCVAPVDVHNDLEVIFSSVEAPRPGFDLDCNIDFKNKGTLPANGTINLYHNDEVMDIVSVYPPYDSYTNNCVSWNYSNLNPFETRNISVVFNLNSPIETPPLNANDILEFKAEITPVENDEKPDDNIFTVHQLVVNSFDPNDKICLEGTALNLEKVGDYVHYLIRFENTGNADAVNIMVSDIIDTTKFDINSFVFLNSSHACEVKINKGNNVEFSFNNINLSYYDDQNDGFINFKIKTLNSLQLNEIFSNRAMIYFDFNAPIYTNNCETVILLNVNTEDIPLSELSINVFPNPVNDILNINSAEPVTKVEIIDLNGRLIRSYSTVKSIPVHDLVKGIYLFRIYRSGKFSVVKVIKN